MYQQERNQKIKQICICALLFLVSMNFYAKFFYLAFVLIFLVLLFQGDFEITAGSIPFLLFSLLTAVYNAGRILDLLRCFTYIGFYWVGYNCIINVSNVSTMQQMFEKKEKRSYNYLFVIACGVFAHFLLNCISNVGADLGRNTNDIWTGEMMAATGQSALACIMLGLSVAMFIVPINKHLRIISVLIIFAIFAYNLTLAGRTILFMFVIVYAIGFLYFIKQEKNSFKKLKPLLILLSIILLCLIVFYLNIGGIKDYILNSNLFDLSELRSCKSYSCE